MVCLQREGGRPVAIVKRGAVWQVQVRVGKDPRTGKWVRKAATCDTEAEARRTERRLLAEAEADRAAFIDPTTETVAEWMAAWLAREEQRLRPSTHEQYKRLVILHILPALGAVPLRELSPRRVQAWVDAMGGRRVAEYARTVLGIALRDAQRLGVVPINVVERTRPAPRTPQKRASFTLEEAQALFCAMEGTRIGPLVRFAFYTGLRRGEALGLRWEDVSGDPPTVVQVRRSIVVVGGHPRVQEPKTEAGAREVPLVQHAVAALRAQGAALAQERLSTGSTWRDEGWVFAAAGGGKWDPNNVERTFRVLVKRAGVAPRPFHALRHSTASVLLGSGVPAEVAAKIMGHKRVGTFADIYADLLRPAAQDAARRMEAFLVDAGRPASPPRRGAPPQ